MAEREHGDVEDLAGGERERLPVALDRSRARGAAALLAAAGLLSGAVVRPGRCGCRRRDGTSALPTLVVGTTAKEARDVPPFRNRRCALRRRVSPPHPLPRPMGRCRLRHRAARGRRAGRARRASSPSAREQSGALEPTTALEVDPDERTVPSSTRSTLAGSWGVPIVTYSHSGAEGLSADGNTLVLGDVVASYPRANSRFLVVDTKTLRITQTIDAEGRLRLRRALARRRTRLYLIQHTSADELQHYVVRAYDLGAAALLPGRSPTRRRRAG